MLNIFIFDVDRKYQMYDPSVKNLHPPNLTLIDIKNFQIIINQDICDIPNIGIYDIIYIFI